jgi:hypothetical protein
MTRKIIFPETAPINMTLQPLEYCIGSDIYGGPLIAACSAFAQWYFRTEYGPFAESTGKGKSWNFELVNQMGEVFR